MGSTAKQWWNLPGSVDNWRLGIEQRIWGLRPRFAGAWRRLSRGDVLFFYATSPIRGVVGHGSVVAKFMGEAPLWPDEIAKGKVIYPHRFEFEIERILDLSRWSSDVVPVRDIRVPIQAMGRITEEAAQVLLARIDVAWGPVKEVLIAPMQSASRHDEAKSLLVEVGRMRGFVVADEFRIDSERIDVVWKKVERGVPAYAFEVQIGGDIYHALGKLKHASDIWNSKIFLALDRESMPKLEELLTGTFHEIERELTVTKLEDIEELRDALSRVHALERKLRLV